MADRGVLRCWHCGKDVVDAHANLMVNRQQFESNSVNGVQVICKECTQLLDEKENGRERFHNIWELYAVRDRPLLYLGEVLQSLRESEWSWEAADNFIDILIELLPKDAASDLLKGYFARTEWDGEGPRSALFKEHRG
jgi:hypothetical protein